MAESIRKRLTAVILALAMVIGLMPAVSLTAYAGSISSQVKVDFNAAGSSWNSLPACTDLGSSSFSNNGFMFTYTDGNDAKIWGASGSGAGSGNSPAIQLNGGSNQIETLTITNTSGSAFKFSSFYLEGIGYGHGTWTVEGFRGATSTGTQDVSTGAVGESAATAGTVTLNSNSNLQNVDRVVISSTSAGFNGVCLDDFVFDPAVAASGISLVANPNFAFTSATEGYSTQAPYSVRVDSTGTAATGNLTVGLSGSSPAAFELSTNSISSIPSGGNNSFTITPATSLSAGTYTATVTVSGDSVTSKSFNVSFTVDPAGTTYNAIIYTYVNGLATDVTGNVELSKGTSRITASKSAAGIYTAAVANGNYFIYVDGTNTGRTIEISSAGNSASLEYYTVSFSATHGGTATNSDIGASVDGVAISSGSKVLSGKTVAITASGTGAGSYTYAWTGSGTSGQTTAELTISHLNTTVSAVCVVTGSGTPPTDPDYEVNGFGHNWTGSDETIALLGASDTLAIHKAPLSAVKIEVQSDDGSVVTINGNSVACDKTRIVVSNDITLTLNNLDITAPLNWSALQLNSDGSSGTMTLNVNGTSTLKGAGYGCGIRSDHDQSIVITGSGILNVAGGGNVSGTDGGSGIFTTSLTHGGSLTVEGDVTINATGGSSLTHSGGSGIDVAAGSILIKSGVINATSGISYGTSSNSSFGIRASFPSGDHSIGGNITIEGGTVEAVGGDAENVTGGYGIYAFNKLNVKGGNVTVSGGNSVNAAGGAGALAYEQNLEVSGGVLNVTGGNSENDYGGQGIYNFYKDILISGGTVTATGGQSTNKDGGRGITVAGTGKLVITGGAVTATGGKGGVNGAHAVYVNLGTITVGSGADLTALGGAGTTSKGGVGLRAAGYDGTTLYGNTVTIANDSGNVYIRGGQGVSEQRASVMGKDVYIGTGNIGPVVMEGSNSRSVKNIAGGDNVYLVNVSAAPAAAVEIRCAVSGGTAPDYTYHAVASADGAACFWLPEGARILSSAGYTSADIDVVDNDTGNTVTLAKPSVVTAHDSTELQTYMAASYVTEINLVNGNSYTYNGGTISRSLTINGNGATVNVGTGIDGTVVKRSSGVPDAVGKVFLEVSGSSLTIKNTTLQNGSALLLCGINVKTGGSLNLDTVNFRGFYANTTTSGTVNNFGVHAEPGAVSTTVTKCSFDSSNAFRNAVAIRGGNALISNNTFVGTADHNRLNKADGFEYAVFLYGGTCTVTGNDMSGYDSVLDPALGYYSAGISMVPYYSLDATITGNTLRNNTRGMDFSGSWHTLSYPDVAKINGSELTTSAIAYKIGENLKAVNTFSGNVSGNIALAIDQNDYYIDKSTTTEYGPPAYYDLFLSAGSVSSTSAELAFDTGAGAKRLISNQKTFGIEISEDNGVNWKTAALSAALNSSSTTAAVTLEAGKTYKLRAVMTITAKTRPYGSIADQDADITVYSNSVSVTTPAASGSSSDKRGSGSTTEQTNMVVEVNGQKQDAGNVNTETSGGKTVTTIKVDDTKLKKILDEKGNNATVTLPVNTSSDVVVGELNGQTVKNMENKEAILEIKTNNVSYILPASQINIDNVSQQIGKQVELKDIKVNVKISEPPADTVKVVEDAANKNSYQLVVKPVEFEITCTSGSKTVDVSRFNGYVERTVAIPDGIDPSRITTGIVLNADGTFRHVPTQIIAINGKYYAKINSLTNSTYSVIYNPVTFADAAKHWAKDAINDMGSRLVVTGDGKGNYNPDRNITRAEFAAIVVRALGLAPGIGDNSFNDVKSSAWYCGYIETAASYGIITGYDASTFGPSDTITREQAMAMLARSMKITGLESSLTQQQISELLSAYRDGNDSSNYAREGIAACLKNGVASGIGNQTIAPKSYVTRAEVAAMFQRLLQKSELI